MDKNKVMGLIEGIIIAVLGVLIAIFGGQSVLDIYFAIVALVGGATLLALSIYAIAKKLPLHVGIVVLASVLIIIGSFLFTDYLNLAGAIIDLVAFIIMGTGAGLVLHGIYTVAKKAIPLGVGEIIIGAAAITISTLYIFVEDFRPAFWIIAGVIIALCGVLIIASQFIKDK